jgi:hypothetical protein
MMRLIPLAIISCLKPLGVLSSTVTREFRKVNEIVSVSLRGNPSDSSQNKLIWNDDDDHDIIVNFRYGPKGEEIVRESQVLRKSDEFFTDVLRTGQVSADMVQFDKEPECLFCHIIRRKKPKNAVMGILRPEGTKGDRVIATAEFKPKDLKLGSAERKRIRAPLRHLNGRSSPDVSLEIDVIKNRWKQIYADAKIDQEGSELELFFRLTKKFFASSLEKTNNLRAFELPIPTQEADPDMAMQQPLPELGSFFFPSNDEFEPVDKKTLFMFKTINKVKIRDEITNYRNRGDAIYECRQTVGNNIIEPKEGRWQNPTRDSSMKRIFFSSIGSHFVKRLPGFEKGFVADCTDLDKYNLRNNSHKYETYGCKTFFDELGNIVKIEDTDGVVNTPGTKHWEWAKLKSRSAAFIKAAFIHFGEVHYMWGNHGGASIRMFLPPNHPFRRALTPHFYKTHHTCRRAQYSLFDREGVLARGLSLDYDTGLKKVFFDYIGGFKYESFADNLKARKVDDCAFHIGATDAMDLFNTLNQYISDLFDEIYPDLETFQGDDGFRQLHDYLVRELSIPRRLSKFTLENVKEVWGEILFRVTGYHNASKSFSIC